MCAAVEWTGADELTLDALRDWARDRLAPYKIPRDLREAKLPRNAMGKVMKVEVAELFRQTDSRTVGRSDSEGGTAS